MVKHVHSELRDVMSEIKTQRAIVRDDLDTGAFYGDERNTETRREVKDRNRPSSLAPDDMDESEIDKILSGETTEEVSTEVTEVIVAQAEADTIPSPEPVPSVEINTAPVVEKSAEKTEEEHIQAFYAQKPTASVGNSTTSSIDDFSDVFENL
jgi:hypothetical protein